jgi:hypothetical protein
VLEQAFNTGQGPGYVPDFSDRTFATYLDEEFGVDIDHERYRENGSSKGKRLRTLLMVADCGATARVLRSLWDHRAAILERRGSEDSPGLSNRYFQIVHQLQGDASNASADAIEKFMQDETLDELVAAIQRDIGANKPQAALDRLHTYCMKKIAHLIELHGGTLRKDEPLHSRAGKYIKFLEAGASLQPISLRIMKSSISIFSKNLITLGTITRSRMATKLLVFMGSLYI